VLSTNPLDYLPQIDQRGLIAKRNLETHAAGFGNTALTVASTIRPADSRTCRRSPTDEYASCSGLDAFFLAGIAPESIIALSLSPTKIKS
jgi:hypothetical protein